MRYARWPFLFGLIVIAAASCGDDPVGQDSALPSAADLDASTGTNPVGSTCGAAVDLPARAVRDDARHAVTIACDGDAQELALTVLDDGIVRMRYSRKGDPEGSIVALSPLPSTRALAAGRRESLAIICTPEVEIAIEPGRCKVHVKDIATGAAIIDDGNDDGFFRSPEGVGVTRSSPENERFYGLGLHSAAGTSTRGLDLRGSSIELYNTDAYDPVAGGFPPNAPHLYETIPFYIGLRGATAYGVFTDETRRTRFDLAVQDKARVRMTSVGATTTSRVEQYVVAGPRIADVVRRYTQITGRAPLPAPWSLGFHQSRWEGPCDGSPAERPFCSASQIAAVAKRFRDSKIPADSIFLDIQHMNGYRSFTFDGARFANPEGLVSELDALGFKTQIIVDPGIKIDSSWDIYKSGLDASHFLKTSTGSVFEGEVWPGPSVFPDFSAQKTRTWWSALAEQAAKRGIRGLWIDMNEPSSFKTGGTVPDDVVVDGDGRGPTTMAELHNAYALFEAKATYEGMKAAHPDERPFVLSRAAFAGQQKWSAVWTGDAPSTWTTLTATLPQLLHLGLSGMAFSGSDVGGYSGRAESTPELFSRWMSLGAISPFFRAHAERDARRQEPWAFGPEVEDATRDLVSIRYELMPYLYSAFDETQRTGAPVLRPLVFDFQDDDKTHAISDEAMLGSQILVAPVLTQAAGAGRSIYLPKSSTTSSSARWFELRSGALYEGGRTIAVSSGIPTEGMPKSALPLFAREGAIIPRTEVGSRVGEKPVLILDVFPAAETKTSFTLYEDDGKLAPTSSRVTFTLERTPTGERLSASAREGTWVGAQPQILVRFRRVDHAPTSTGALWDPVDRSATVTLPNQFPFTIDLAYDAKLESDGDVAVPIKIKLPPGTPSTTSIHVASSRTGWTHAPLTARIGDEATGTIPVTRGGWAFFKITRGGWPTVEKDAACAEISNRAVFGAASPITIEVKRWADLCP
jgi:alpha-glucosidase